MKPLRTEILRALKDQYEANIHTHRVNVEVYLQNPVGVGEHTDTLESITKEIEQMSHWQDLLHTLEEYFEEE
jgi:hypothetical protein